METADNEKIIYSKEEFAEKVRVPSVVEQDLKRIISERLERCGLYFRVFSRIKTSASMAGKFGRKEYGEDRKLQDLVGVRVNLYFDDDVEICRKIMENTFDLIEWSTSERSEEEFKPTKLNGVFRLPEYLKAEISPQTWDMCIDDTFEIQIKTMFFEGWHEIEHDMRYKGEELWKHFPGFSRYFNSILATLELCDKSMVTLFEDLGHALYKSGQWTDMIRSHFRLKMEEAVLYPEVEQLLDADQVHVESLGKRIYKTSKPVLVDLLQKRSRPTPINVNTIIAVLNEGIFHNEQLSAIFRERDVYNDGLEETVAESRHYQLRPLVRHRVFQMEAVADGNRIRGSENISRADIFRRSADAIYNWVKAKYGSLFINMPQEVTSYQADIMAYHVVVQYDQEHQHMQMHVRHMDMEVGGRIWFAEALLQPESDAEDARLIFKICNGYAEPERDRFVRENTGMFFSYPGFYKSIVDTIGIRSGTVCSNHRRILTEQQAPEMAAAILDPERQFPIILIASEWNKEGMLDENWLGAFRVSDFTRTVWRYAHVFTAPLRAAAALLGQVCPDREVPENGGKMIIFWPDGDTDIYTREDVEDSTFGRHTNARGDTRTYDIVRGGQAFYHRVVNELRDGNVAADMWSGFQLETMTEIPR